MERLHRRDRLEKTEFNWNSERGEADRNVHEMILGVRVWLSGRAHA